MKQLNANRSHPRKQKDDSLTLVCISLSSINLIKTISVDPHHSDLAALITQVCQHADIELTIVALTLVHLHSSIVLFLLRVVPCLGNHSDSLSANAHQHHRAIIPQHQVRLTVALESGNLLNLITVALAAWFADLNYLAVICSVDQVDVVVPVQTASEVVLCVLDHPSDLFIFEKDAFKHVYMD